jgi:hypothetical protein
MRFLRDFLSGRKEIMKFADMNKFNVPQYEELTVKNVFEQVKDDDNS